MDASPSELKIKKRKRRAVLSCNDCRRRKLKCDRELPCNRCINGGIANACAYGHENDSTLADVLTSNAARETTETSLKVTEPPVMKNSLTEKLTKSPVQPSATASDNLREEYIERLERRVASLEAHLATLTGVTGSQPLLSKVQQADPAARESTSQLLSLFKGEGFRTFAYGPTSPITIVVHFPQLRPFMKEVYPDSTLERVQEEVKVLEDRARSSKISKTVLSVPYLRSLLPERGTVDVLIRQYLDTFETTYRIVHIPSFLAEYQNFWGSQPIPDSDFEALVLAILACVLCTSTHEATRHNPNGSTFRSKAIIWVKACEAWLKRQSNKHRTLASIQIRCLRLLALKTTCLKTKEFYQETQAHMAYMRTIGMHRDPSILQSKLRTRCSAFEGEMRRRLWATSLELELQASIDRGTPSVLSGLEYDCSPPQNIHDSDLLVDMDQLPSAQPISTFTDTSFLHFSMQTAPLRTTLCAMTNRLHSGPDSQEVSGYEAKIQEALEKLPKWPESKSFQAWTHLDLQLRQFLVILHTHRALQAQFRMKPDHRYSILTCLEAAITLIERHMDLVNSGNYVLCCIRSDYYRAALILCHITWHASNDSDTLVLRVAQSLFDDAIEKAFRLQEERAVRPGRGNKQFWYVSAACSLVRIKLHPDRTEVLKRQAVDRVSRILYKILSLQDDPSDHDLANEVILGNGFTAAEARSAVNTSATSAIPSNTFPNPGLRLDSFDFGNTSEWMLDDFWFFNDFPPLDFSN